MAANKIQIGPANNGLSALVAQHNASMTEIAISQPYQRAYRWHIRLGWYFSYASGGAGFTCLKIEAVIVYDFAAGAHQAASCRDFRLALMRAAIHASISFDGQPTARSPSKMLCGNFPALIFAYKVDRLKPVCLRTSGARKMVMPVVTFCTYDLHRTCSAYGGYFCQIKIVVKRNRTNAFLSLFIVSYDTYLDQSRIWTGLKFVVTQHPD